MSRKDLSIIGQGRLWRSLDELAQTPQFEEMVHREFPENASEWQDETSRRTFLKLMSASLALAGVGGCTYKPEEKVVPYVNQPEQLVPGRPLYFATTVTFGGFARGVLVESHEGRPTKIEGNPDHPATLGATDVFTQASILNLYDPDRSQTVMRAGEVGNWSLFTHALEPRLAAAFTRRDGAENQQRRVIAAAKQEQTVRILTRTITSPTLLAQIRRLTEQHPEARWHQYDPVNRDNSAAGARMALGQAVSAVYRFDQAKVIVSLDDNFLVEHPASIRYARDFINGRRVRSNKREMNRLYVAESTPTITGAMADHRVRVKPGRIEAIARELLAAIDGNSSDPWIAAAAKDLNANRGAGLVVVGESQPPAVHALGHALNAALGNIGTTVVFIDPPQAEAGGHVESLAALVEDMNAGRVPTLIIIDGNPAYDAPADLKFADALEKFSNQRDDAGNFVNFSAHLGTHNDETSFLCHWHLPLSHELESWGDARAYDGTASLIQPLIAPLYESRSAIEVMALLLGDRDRSAYELLRAHWRGERGEEGFEAWWEKSLHDGVIADSAAAVNQVTVTPSDASAMAQATTAPSSGIELVFRADPCLWDGAYANNGWLQELPKPLTKLTWDNAALMSAATAARLGVIDITKAPGNRLETSLVRLTVGAQSVNAPAWILPGQPDDVITVHLGGGRSRAGRVGSGVGFDAYPLRTSSGMWSTSDVKVERLDDVYAIACTQNHQMMDQHGRELVHVAPIAHYEDARHAPGHGGHGAATASGGEHTAARDDANGKRTVHLPVHEEPGTSLYPEYDYSKGNKWGMVIDQNACIGCNACVIACQSENNIPVVGKEQVAKAREMHWLRIDTYFGGEAHEAEGPYFQPLTCMHCEKAPCEVVCPVVATVHDAEGTNNMVYNRCVGTRYCSNNCPYKVRRFNFLHYTEPIKQSAPLMQMMNPDVTVRYKGVMEKCSYCIQRINHGRIEAKKEDRAIRDGEVVTACAQACPTQAIVFGNLNDPVAAVTKLAHEPTNYGLLEDLQTQPRTTYLPRFVNRSNV